MPLLLGCAFQDGRSSPTSRSYFGVCKGPDVGSLSLPDADERGDLLYDKSSAPEVFTKRTMMFLLGSCNSSVLELKVGHVALLCLRNLKLHGRKLSPMPMDEIGVTASP
ncbi:hypothetical protein GRJ2_000256300 [Grus japonensis]|uniref:Uncharacterized protein n=1 Tax=Grus japonensis TaxID=30415 RepID=A0ABC9VWZ1_GRUJA